MATSRSLSAIPTKSFASVEAMVGELTPSYPVYCIRPGVLKAAARRFLERFPGRVLYAVKCNPDERILRILHDAGIVHFDSASLPEIALVRELFPDAVNYFMHPVKARAVIRAAYSIYGVRHFVLDHPNELAKVLDETGGEQVAIIVRLATPDAGAIYELSRKFGAQPEEAAALLKMVAREGLQGGLAFHVGSQCASPDAYRTALSLVGRVVEMSGTDIHFLDVGGGFPAPYPGTDAPPLETFFEAIDAGLMELGLRRDCVVMCEPGRALVAEGMSLIVQVQLRKGDQLYVNDGIYGSLSEAKVAGLTYPARLIRLDGEPSAEQGDFLINGPTCDSVDVLPEPFRLPADAREGDWIEIGAIGAYSNANSTRFNGFFPETYVEIHDGADVGLTTERTAGTAGAAD